MMFGETNILLPFCAIKTAIEAIIEKRVVLNR